jgi:hypothetical protein
MNMNRLRNVAVRIRPLAATPATEADPDSDPLPSRDVVQPRRPVSNGVVRHDTPRADAIPTSRRQIWDIEADETPEDGVPEQRAVPVEPPAPRRAPPDVPPALPGAAAPGRAKTRMLGFHANELDADVFGATEPATEGPRFPAGFLVVVEGPGRGAFFAVTTRVSSIGRGADQDVALDFGDEAISRESHASVVYDAEQNRFFLGHGNKANVVRRNGIPVLATEELAHGDLIRIGKTSLRFHAFCGEDFTWADTDATCDAAGRHD